MMVVGGVVAAVVLLCAALFGFLHSNSAAREPKRFDVAAMYGVEFRALMCLSVATPSRQRKAKSLL